MTRCVQHAGLCVARTHSTQGDPAVLERTRNSYEAQAANAHETKFHGDLKRTRDESEDRIGGIRNVRRCVKVSSVAVADDLAPAPAAQALAAAQPSATEAVRDHTEGLGFRVAT